MSAICAHVITSVVLLRTSEEGNDLLVILSIDDDRSYTGKISNINDSSIDFQQWDNSKFMIDVTRILSGNAIKTVSLQCSVHETDKFNTFATFVLKKIPDGNIGSKIQLSTARIGLDVYVKGLVVLSSLNSILEPGDFLLAVNGIFLSSFLDDNSISLFSTMTNRKVTVLKAAHIVDDAANDIDMDVNLIRELYSTSVPSLLEHQFSRWDLYRSYYIVNTVFHHTLPPLEVDSPLLSSLNPSGEEKARLHLSYLTAVRAAEGMGYRALSSAAFKSLKKLMMDAEST